MSIQGLLLMPNNTGDYEITGALLKSRKNSKAYEDNYERIFRKKDKPINKKKGRS